MAKTASVFSADWTYRTPQVTIDFAEGDPAPTDKAVYAAAQEAGVLMDAPKGE